MPLFYRIGGAEFTDQIMDGQKRHKIIMVQYKRQYCCFVAKALHDKNEKIQRLFRRAWNKYCFLLTAMQYNKGLWSRSRLTPGFRIVENGQPYDYFLPKKARCIVQKYCTANGNSFMFWFSGKRKPHIDCTLAKSWRRPKNHYDRL
jgi:hypothetical protein